MAMGQGPLAFLMRLIALGATISATLVMVTARDSATVLNLTFDAKYTNSPSFEYFVIANAIASAYSLVILFLPSKFSFWRLVLILDIVVSVLLDSSISVALAIGYVGKKGNEHAGWLPVCGQVPKFCNHIAGAMASGFVAALLYFVLVIYSLRSFLILVPQKP
ncbi:CASP-like protein 1C1 [Impatiens glandulifera]|uniref:CASP-like protein 1C1 n=1 Tax=Impatiens glandulifera TaxID=253017 RepID=UPI001FB10316|nr:CASP-like protein 1C1 [Impatiens glandulifera]